MENPLKHQIEKIETLADEARLKLHLASLDAKKEWDETISPRLLELRQVPVEKLEELKSLLEGYVARLRGHDGAPA